eukprot:TRINITY_DN238_c2_g1_i1.p1 TRINITY_DN238_c2_g1~~TRINITY_DN238_c2_g1_i1.p1  ORF type:complete len:330 (+),score=76.30 TRINITY_DN238_c2_g1_i1:124-1113(+)
MVYSSQPQYTTTVIPASDAEWECPSSAPVMIPQSNGLMGGGELRPMEPEYVTGQYQNYQPQYYANESFSSGPPATPPPCSCAECMPGLVTINSSPEESFSGSVSGESTPGHTILSTSTGQYTHDPYSVEPLSIGMPAEPVMVSTPPPAAPLSFQEVREALPVIENTMADIHWSVELEFKHGRRENFEMRSGFGSEPVIGSWYVVEGDRGHDVAMALSCTEINDSEPKKKTMKKVVREATQQELEYHQKVLTEEERPAVSAINSILRSSGINNVHVYAAAYQLDKKKISFFYESRQRQPDFRSVLSECYAHWKCRIWFTTVPRRYRKDLN